MRSIFALLLVPLVVLAATANIGPNSYVVVMKPNNDTDVDNLVNEILKLLGLQPVHKYTGSIKGFAATLDNNQLSTLKANTNVAYVENDGVLKTLGVISKRSLTTESNAPWGLGRISHSEKGSTNYVYDTSSGTGTCSYVLDTGIHTANTNFQGRATTLANFDTTDGTSDDLMGHGTHVAGIIGSSTYGVAKKTNVYSVKVCNQYGACNLSDIIAGINFAVSDYKTRSCPNGATINLSFGAPNANWQSMRDSIVAATEAGIFVAAAAGNDNADAKGYAPASMPGACAVGATDINDAKAGFSNYGSIIAAFAPGVNVLSTWIGSNTATAYQDGTSMSAPHVAGLAAYIMGMKGKQSPVGLCVLIENSATKNAISGLPGGTPNRLAYNSAA